VSTKIFHLLIIIIILSSVGAKKMTDTLPPTPKLERKKKMLKGKIDDSPYRKQ